MPAARGDEKLTRDTLFGELFEHDIPDIDRAAPGLQYRWCIQGKWKLIVPKGEREPELYDVLADPREENDAAQRNPEVVAALRKKLDAWWDGK